MVSRTGYKKLWFYATSFTSQYSLLCLLCFHDLIFDLITIAVTVCCIECKLEESKKTQSAYCSENEIREKEYDEDNFDNGEENEHEEY
jgi:hypothetical protein